MTNEAPPSRVYVPVGTPRYRVRRVDRERWLVAADGGAEEWLTTAQVRATLERSRYDEIPLRAVASSQIDAIGYDVTTWDLLVLFSGKVPALYRYFDVDPEVGRREDTPEERDVFAACRVAWVEPRERLSAAAVRAVRG